MQGAFFQRTTEQHTFHNVKILQNQLGCCSNHEQKEPRTSNKNVPPTLAPNRYLIHTSVHLFGSLAGDLALADELVLGEGLPWICWLHLFLKIDLSLEIR